MSISNDLDGTYVLMNDIPCYGIPLSSIGIGPNQAFSGVFDGQGYTISDFKISTSQYMGLFGYNTGTIRNLNVDDLVIDSSAASGTSDTYIGGIVGYNAGTVESCSVSGNIGVNMNVGIRAGLIAGMNTGIIKNVITTGNVSVSANRGGDGHYVTAGGIVGTNSGTIQYAFTNSTVYSVNHSQNFYARSRHGLVCGVNESKGKIEGCIVLGSYSGGNQFAYGNDIANVNDGSFSNCYKATGVTLGSQATTATEAQLSNPIFYEYTLKWSSEDWDYTNVNLANGQYPVLKQ